MFLIYIVAVVSWWAMIDGHRFLLVPLPMRSHTFSFHVIAKELERQGHEVHMILEKTYKAPKAFVENTSVVYHTYGLENKNDEIINFDEETSEFAQEMMVSGVDVKLMLEKTKKYNRLVSNDLLMHSERLFGELEKIKFQAVIVDALFFMKFAPLVAHRLRAPLIVYSDTINPWVIRTPWFPSIFTQLDGVEKTPTFLKRLTNTLSYALQLVFPLNPPMAPAVLEKYRKYGYFEDEDDLIRKATLFLWPKDPVMYPLPPCTANMVLVGGLTTDFTTLTSVDLDLPREYKEFVKDTASKGTIVVSFGSMVKNYPEKTAKIFTDTFRRFPQYRFIWRFENDLSLDLPPNVMAVKWLPQKELLSHSSVRLFVTHAGNNGLFEAIYHGVPILSMPLFGDQPGNARRMVEMGYGESLELILKDPLYKVRTLKASKIFKSQRETPAQRTAYWINHVVEFGSDHLRPIGNDLHLFQYLCLDVVLFLQVCLLVILAVFVVLFRKLLRMFGLLAVSKKHKQN